MIVQLSKLGGDRLVSEHQFASVGWMRSTQYPIASTSAFWISGCKSASVMANEVW